MTIYIDTTVEIEAYEVLSDLRDNDLISELNRRGYSVSEDPLGDVLNESDIVWIKELILENCDMPNDIEAYNVYEKLRAMI